MFSLRTINKKEWLWIGAIILVGLAVFLYKIHLGILDYGGDYIGYIGTAKFIAGVPGAVVSGSRVLKPLEPLANALLAPVFGWQVGFLIIVGFFYCLLVPATWLFFKNIFESLLPSPSIFYPASATILFALSYPMLRYGLDAYTETGALFFYTLALLGVWYVLKRPGWRSLLFTLLTVVLGFLWKEYVVIPIIILQIIVLWHPLLKRQTGRKIRYLVFFDGAFLLCNVIWQGIVYYHFHYSYLQWYLQGGASGFHSTWSVFIVLKSLFALLIAGWFFLPFGFLELRRLREGYRANDGTSLFFWLILLVPLICLGWGAVSSRLFYVCVPAFIILCLLGIRWCIRRPHDQATIVVLLLAIDFFWLFFHL